MGSGGVPRQTARRPPEVPDEGIPTEPSVSLPPTDPGTEGTKDLGDGARAPRDSEVSMAGHPASQFCPATHQPPL